MAVEDVLSIARQLAIDVDALRFAPPVTHCYNPLQYAWDPFAEYLRRYATNRKEVLFIGMNPGPFGMAQTGVPFGDCRFVRDWLEIHGNVEKPMVEHPKRPVDGFNCSRGEVSGQRLWGWAKNRFETPSQFFSRFFVWNYCPLCFMGESGKNLTPDKLPKAEREALFQVCDRALAALCAVLTPELAVGVGKFASDRASSALAASGTKIGTILHPSPASPVANRGWQEQAEKQLAAMGVAL